jgi:hypothetical protein
MTIPRVIALFVALALLGKLVGALGLSGWLAGLAILVVIAFIWQLVRLWPSRQYDEYAMYGPHSPNSYHYGHGPQDEHSRDFRYL